MLINASFRKFIFYLDMSEAECKICSKILKSMKNYVKLKLKAK